MHFIFPLIFLHIVVSSIFIVFHLLILFWHAAAKLTRITHVFFFSNTTTKSVTMKTDYQNKEAVKYKKLHHITNTHVHDNLIKKEIEF